MKAIIGNDNGKAYKPKSIKLVRLGQRFQKVFYTILIAIIALIFLMPIVVTVTNSFMPESEIYDSYKSVNTSYLMGGDDNSSEDYSVFVYVPEIATIKQYYQVIIKNIGYLFYFWNSVKIVIPIICGQLIVASMAAYAFSKFNFRFKEQLFFIYIVTMLLPFQVTLVPNYIIADKLGLIGKFSAIIFPGIFTTFGVFLLRQFMIYIPNEYSEAAKVDGAGHFSTFLRIIIPMTRTGLASLIILLFIDNWNMVEQPLIFLKELKDYPLSIALSSINKDEMGVSFAAATIYMAPMLLIFLYGENYLVEGLQLSGIKG